MQIKIKVTSASVDKVWAEIVVPMERDTGFNSLQIDGPKSSQSMKNAAKFFKKNDITHVVLNGPSQDVDEDSSKYGGAIVLLYGPKENIKKLGMSEGENELVFLRRGLAALGLYDPRGNHPTNLYLSVVDSPKASKTSVIFDTGEVILQFSTTRSAGAKPVIAYLEDPSFDYTSSDIV